MPQSPLRVLLVEDSESYAGLVKIHLTRAIPGVRLFHEITLAGGIEQLARETADAAILDLNLPDSRGIDTFVQLQARFPRIPVIVLTGYEDDEIATLAMRLGAEDYLNKNEIDGRSLARSLRYAIERHRHQEGLHALEAAGAIQRTLFPHGPMCLGGLEITGRCDSMLATGGDYYDYFPLDERRMALVVADVSGHGIGPALIMAETRAALRILCTVFSDPGEVLTYLNRFLGEHLASAGFVTLFLGQVDVATGQLSYASAGHNGLLMGADGVPRDLDHGDMPLGIEKETIYTCSEPVELKAGEVIVVHTDGINETMSLEREMFQITRVVEVVHRHRHECPESIIEHLFRRAREFAGDVAPLDDMTAIVAKVNGQVGDPPAGGS